MRVTIKGSPACFCLGPSEWLIQPLMVRRWWWWRCRALTLSRALLAPEDQAGNMLLSPMPLLLLLLLVLLLLLLQTTLLLCKFLLLFHGLELLLELRNMQTSSQHIGSALINILLKRQWLVWTSAVSILLWWTILCSSVKTKLTLFCNVLLHTLPCCAELSLLFCTSVMLSWAIMFSTDLHYAMLCCALLFCTLCCCAVPLCTLLCCPPYNCSVQCRPWGAPGAEPGADGSTSHAASGTRWLVAASGSAVASEWGAAPAAAASPKVPDLSLAPASSDQCASPTEIRVPQPMARLA